MSKVKKFLLTISAFVLTAVLAAGIAVLTINCSSESDEEREVNAAEAMPSATYSSGSYSSLSAAVSAAVSTSANNTLQLTQNYTVTSTITISSGYYLTLDLNGYTITTTDTTRPFYISGNMTVIDSTASLTVSSASSYGSSSITTSGNGYQVTYYVQTDTGTYKKHVYKSGGFYGGTKNDGIWGNIYVAGGGTLNWYNGIVYGKTMFNGGAFGAYGSSGNKANLNMYGGVLYGNTATAAGAAIYTSDANVNVYAGAIIGNTAKYGIIWSQNTGYTNLGFKSGVSLGTSKYDTLYVGGNTCSTYGTVYSAGSVELNIYDNVSIYRNTVGTYGSIVYQSSSTAASVNGGKFLYNTASTCGGIYLCSNKSVNISGGTFYGNTTESSSSGGAAVYAASSTTLNITGGTFNNNTAVYTGGAICLGGSSCTATISGATFSGNTTTKQGGYGGAIYSYGKNTVTIKNTTVSDGKSYYAAGMYFTSGDTVTISNTTVKNNESTYEAGGIYNHSATLTISNSTISGNTSWTYGGGIYNTGTLSLSDTEMTGNYAATYGGALYYSSSGSLSVSGAVNISDNDTYAHTAPNVYVVRDAYITLGGTLSSSSSIGIGMASSTQTQLTTAETSTTRYKSSVDYFHLDNDSSHFIGYTDDNPYLCIMSTSDAPLTVVKGGTTTYFGNLSSAITEATGTSSSNCGTVYLHQDLGVSSTVSVAGGTYLAIDLNGCTLSWTGSTKSNFFAVSGNLSLYDSTATGGKITGSATAGVATVTSSSGTQYKTTYPVMDETGITSYYYYQSGAIKDGQATSSASSSDTTARGGAVYVASSGTFNMYGGTLYNNTSTYGGAVHCYGKFYMYGGAISENSSTNSSTNYNGGGVLIDSGASATLYGGVVYGNTASGKGYGGGVDNIGTLVLSSSASSYDLAGLGPVISSNSSSAYGGGILNTGTMTVTAGYVTLNTSVKKGAGVYSAGSGFAMAGGKITGNETEADGGGAYVSDAFTLSGGYINYNTAATTGGGVSMGNNATLTMSGGGINHNTAGTYGGGIDAGGRCYISGGTIDYNTAGSSGGGINTGYTVEISGGELSHNTASATGGGIFSSSTVNISGGTLSSNTAGTSGGGVYSTGTVTISGGSITYNTATTYGGGIVVSGTATITSSPSVSYNKAGTDGGGIYVGSSATLSVSGNPLVNQNKAEGGYGGGIYAVSSASTTISGGTISNNTASESGGGVWSRGTLSMTGGTISNNTAGSYGGGVEIYGKTFTMSGGEITGNKATHAGGVSVSQSGTAFTMSGGTISENESTTSNGGGVYAGMYGTYFTLTGGTISGNKSAGVGGGVFCNDNSTVVLSGGEISNNTASTYGGGVYFASSASLTIGGNVTISGNTSEADTPSENNLYFPGGTTVTLDGTFAGTVCIYSATEPTSGNAVKFSKNTMTEEEFLSRVNGRITSDQGYCVGYDGYVYLYETHDDALRIAYDEDKGEVYAYYLCTQCLTPTGGEFSGTISYAIASGGTLYAYAYDDDGLYDYMELDFGYAVVTVDVSTGTEKVCWYSEISDAVEAVTDGSALILYSDVTAENAADGLSFDCGGDVTLDLNGHTVSCAVTAGVDGGTSTTLTIEDSSGGDGAVAGEISANGNGDSEVMLHGGTYYGEDILSYVDCGNVEEETRYYALYCGTDDKGEAIYKVYSESEITDHAAFYIESGDGGRIYYSSIGDAIACASEGDTIVLAKDADTGELKLTTENVAIDLNGFTLTADITIEAGSVEKEGENERFSKGATLTITDSSAERAGAVIGSVNVYGESLDKEGTGEARYDENSFSDTLTIAATAVSDALSVSYPELSSSQDTYTYTFAETEDGVYAFVTEHNHVYNIAEAYMDSDGVIKVRIKCSCGYYYAADEEEGDYGTEKAEDADVFLIPDGATLEVVENADGTVSYVFTPSEASGTGVITLTDESGSAASPAGGVELKVSYSEITLTMTPTVKIELTVDGAAVTYYLDDDTMDALGSIIAMAETDEDVTVTLMSDADVGTLEISGGNVTIDLAGYALTGGITLSDGASLDITDSGAENDEGEFSGAGCGTVEKLTVEIGDDCDFTISGGTYTDEGVTVTGSAGEDAGSIRDFVNSSGRKEGNAKYCIMDNGDGTFTVMTSAAAEKYAAVKVITEDGGEVYFTSAETALEYIYENEISGATIVLVNDSESENGLTISEDVTVDLNGKTLDADITVEGGATLSVKDSSATCDENGNLTAAGTGLLSGDVEIGEGGELAIYSGSFTEDVGAYVVSVDVVLVAASDEDGNMIYTVTPAADVEDAIAAGDIQASITYGDADGNDVTVYYESAGDAAASLKDGDVLTILGDIGSEESRVDLTISDASGVTVDFGGNTVYGDIFVDGDSSVTVTSGSGENTGLLCGSLSGDGVIVVESGSFTEDVAAYVADPYVLVASTDEETGTLIYTVTTKAEAEAVAEAVVSYTVADGDEKTVYVYYEGVTDAAASLKDGDTLTLLKDLNEEGDENFSLDFVSGDADGNTVDFTLDLDGHDVNGEITAGDFVNLTITDSGYGTEDGAGYVFGEIETKGNGSVTIDGGIYAVDVSEYTDEGHAVYAETDENGYSFEVVPEEDITGSAASVTYTVTDGDGMETTYTVYFDDIENAIDYAGRISSGDGSATDVVVTLTDDLTYEDGANKATIKIESGTFTVDTNGHAVEADIEIGSDADVTMTGAAGIYSGDIAVGGGGSLTISGDLEFTGEMTSGETGEGEITVSGGTFAADVSEWVEEGYGALASTNGDETTYTVMEKWEAQEEAKASLTVFDSDGNEIYTTYFDTFEDAFAALDKEMNSDDGNTCTLTLWDDLDTGDLAGSALVDEDGSLVLEGDFTLDLNGHTVTGGVTVAGASDGDGSGSSVVIDFNGGKIDGDVTIESGSSAEMDLDGGKIDGDVVVDAGASANIDLDGGTVTGAVIVGTDDSDKAGDGAAELAVSDSSAGSEIGADGTGAVLGGIADNNDENDITVSGGTFSGDVSAYVDGDVYAVIVGEGGETSIVVPAEGADERSAAYVEAGGVTTYYESIDDAVNAVTENGGTLTLTDDASVGGVIEIRTDVTIDLNGHTLDADIVIYADANDEAGIEGGKLVLTDGSDGGDGAVTGSITVVGDENHIGEDEGGASGGTNPYADTLVMEGGVAPNAGLEINLDGLGEKGEYAYSEITDEETGAVSYGIVPAERHEHLYDIEVWTLGDDGSVTLSFMCACGEYLSYGDGTKVVYDAAVTITDCGDGTYTFDAVITISADDENVVNGVLTEGEYTCGWTKSVAATVESGGKTYYIEDLQAAVELAEKLGGATVTLNRDFDGDVEIKGDVELDLNGYDVDGVVTVDTGAYLIISGDGNVGGLDIEDKANVKIRGGTYDVDLEEIDDYIDYYDGYVPVIWEDGTISVMREGSAATNARAAVTDADGDTVYYESLEEAVEALEDGCTLTLWDDLGENETINIKGLENVTVNANGFDVSGTIEFTDSDGAAIEMDGGTVAETGKIVFTGCDDASLTMGGDDVPGGDISGSVRFDGCEGASVDMAGGEITETGSVTFTGSDGAALNTDGGDIKGEITFTNSENASLTMGGDDVPGGDISGSVTFDGCEGASVDMAGGDITETGSVTFTGSDGAALNTDGGDIEGEITFTNSENASLTMGGDERIGGDISGSVTFDGCEGASVDMAGGDITETGSVTFTGSDDASFNLGGGDMDGVVEFDGSDGGAVDLGGGTVTDGGKIIFTDSESTAVDLGGGNIQGELDITDGSFVEITGEGFVDTVRVDEKSDLDIKGGTYDDEETARKYLDDECIVMTNDDGTYTVTTEEDACARAAAYVTYEGEDGNAAETYFTTLEEALNFAAENGGTVVLNNDCGSGAGVVISGDTTIDLAGHGLEGDITVSAGTTLTIVDTAGGGTVSGKLGDNNGAGTLIATAGTYTDGNVSDFLDADGDGEDDFVVVISEDGEGQPTYTVMTTENAAKNSYVIVETYGDDGEVVSREYYETLAEAIEAASGVEKESAVILTGDTDAGEIEITSPVVIDTAGHNLDADITVVVADGDDLSIDGSVTFKDGSEEGTGSVTGSITVVDGSESGSENGYSDALVMEDGLTPGDDLDIDLSGLGDESTRYGFAEVTDEESGETSYAITAESEHSFTIPVWTVDGDGSVTLGFKCACGEYLTQKDENGNDVTDGDGNPVRVGCTLTGADVEDFGDGTFRVTGTVTVTEEILSDSGSIVEITTEYDCDMYVEAAATVVTSDGETHFFDSVQEAVSFAGTHGGYVTLYEDADGVSVKAETQYAPLYNEDGEPLTDAGGNQLYEEVYTDVVIDLNGHNLGISIQAEKGDSVTLTDSAEERGTAYVGLCVDGVVIFDDVNVCMSENVVEGDTDVDGEIWIRGDTTIDLGDMTIFNVDVIEGNLTITGGEGSSLKLGADIDLSDGSITMEGDAGIDLGGNDLTADITVADGASFDLNLNGATFTGDIDLGEGSSLTIRDSSISKSGEIESTVFAENAEKVTAYDGVYDPYDDDSSLVIDLADGVIMQSASDSAGETYYESVSESQHSRQGHGYDVLTGWTFNAESSTMTLYYECVCGETSVRIINVTEDDYKAEVASDGTVTVTYAAEGLITALNGSDYAYSVSGTVTLSDKISDGESANGYVHAVIDAPDCWNTGLDTYTYGNGKGIVVRVVTPVTHKLDEEYTDEETGITYYWCSECGCYVTGEHAEAMYDNPDDLIEDVGLQSAYDDEKQAALDELESWKDEIMSGIDPETPGYDKVIEKIEEIFDELYDEISGMDYVPQTDTGEDLEEGWRQKYADALTEALTEALAEAELEIDKTANREVSRNILEDVYNGLAESGKYGDDSLDELKGEFDAAIADLEGLTVTSEDDLAALYDEFLRRVIAALYAVRIDRALTTGDSAVQGYVDGSEGFDSGVEVIITDMGTAGYTFTTEGGLIYKGTEDLTDEDVASLVEGKGIVAVFDISLVDSMSGAEVFVFSGYYVVRIELPEYALAYDGLQIVFVGDDGRVEVYDTHVDGMYLEFTTTHFSEYIILGIGATISPAEKDTDLMPTIIALSVVDGVLLVLGIILLAVFLTKRRSDGRSKKVASFAAALALLAVTPSGGIAIVVVLGVLALAFLAADIYLIYALATFGEAVVEYVDEGGNAGENAGQETGEEGETQSEDAQSPEDTGAEAETEAETETDTQGTEIADETAENETCTENAKAEGTATYESAEAEGAEGARAAVTKTFDEEKGHMVANAKIVDRIKVTAKVDVKRRSDE